MKKAIAGVALMAACNDSIISAIVLCFLVIAFLAWLVKEADKHNH